MLTPQQIASYKRDGFLLLDGIFSKEEIEECSTEYNNLFQRKKECGSNLEAHWAGDWRRQDELTSSLESKSVHDSFNKLP